MTMGIFNILDKYIKKLKVAWYEGKAMGVRGYRPPFKEMRKKAVKDWKDEKGKDK